MDIREIQMSEIEEARRLLCENGWGHRVGDPELFRQLVARSQRAIVAVEGRSVIGFARAICDDISNGYLSMVVVDRAHRRRGVGRALVRAVTGDDPRVTWVLRAGRPEELPFFERLGFVPSKIAMERTRATSLDASPKPSGQS
jgi:ribosomal protein S18 acetylase RimI-like enzyme